MKTKWFARLLIGGIVYSACNIVIGFIFGLVLGIYTDQTYSGPPIADSAIMFAFVFPVVLITTGGPLAGAILGLISNYLKSLRALAFSALIVGLIHGLLCFWSTSGDLPSVWTGYTLLAIVSALITSLTLYRFWPIDRTLPDQVSKPVNKQGLTAGDRLGGIGLFGIALSLLAFSVGGTTLGIALFIIGVAFLIFSIASRERANNSR